MFTMGERIVDKIYELESMLSSIEDDVDWKDLVANQRVHIGFQKCAFLPWNAAMSHV